MMTQTHTLIAASLLTDSHQSARYNLAVLCGSFVPDIALYGLFFWSKLAGIEERLIWEEVYFSEPMLTYTAVVNSLPLYLVLFFVGILLTRQRYNVSFNTHSVTWFSKLRERIFGSMLCLFSVAAISHLLADFPVHADDAHPHFWPFTDWRFYSPVSYWDHAHYGDLFRYIESFLGVVLSAILFRRFLFMWVRVALMIAVFAYILVPMYFALKLG